MEHLILTTPNCFLIQYCFWSILTKMCPSDHAFMILLKCMKKNHAILRCAKTRFMHMLVTWHGMVWVTVFYWVLAHDEVQTLQVVNINMWNHRQVLRAHCRQFTEWVASCPCTSIHYWPEISVYRKMMELCINAVIRVPLWSKAKRELRSGVHDTLLNTCTSIYPLLTMNALQYKLFL